MTEGLPEGFANECEEISLEVRKELGLHSYDRLDPRNLAELLGIEVISIEEFREACPEEVGRLTDDTALSAVTFFCGTRCKVLINPWHSTSHQVNSIAHELAHVMLEHQPKLLFDKDCERVWCGTEEDEADYLADALLIPRKAVGTVMGMTRGDVATAAAHFDVSMETMRRRIKQGGHEEDPAREGSQVQVEIEEAEAEAEQPSMSTVFSQVREPPGDKGDGGEPEPASSPVA